MTYLHQSAADGAVQEDVVAVSYIPHGDHEGRPVVNKTNMGYETLIQNTVHIAFCIMTARRDSLDARPRRRSSTASVTHSVQDNATHTLVDAAVEFTNATSATVCSLAARLRTRKTLC